MRLVTRFVLGVVLLGMTVQDTAVEVYIPDGMPLTLEVERNEEIKDIVQYDIRESSRAPDVLKFHLITVIIRPDGKVSGGSGHDILLDKASLAQLAGRAPSTVAWGLGAKVERLLVIVERVETEGGVWVLDADSQHVDIKAVVERGMEAIPRARFIKR